LIKEGSAITQQALADHFGVSRMPAREALRQVEAQGFIVHRLNRSPIVVRPAAYRESSDRVQQLEAQLRKLKEVFDCMYRDPQGMAGYWRELAREQAENIDSVLAVTH
jgi:DNA-binding FadR family transcriptional regulator